MWVHVALMMQDDISKTAQSVSYEFRCIALGLFVKSQREHEPDQN